MSLEEADNLQWLLTGPVHSVIFSSLFFLSIFSNSLLIYALWLTRRNIEIGNYRYLLFVFSICDLLSSLAHFIIEPVSFLSSGKR